MFQDYSTQVTIWSPQLRNFMVKLQKQKLWDQIDYNLRGMEYHADLLHECNSIINDRKTVAAVSHPV